MYILKRLGSLLVSFKGCLPLNYGYILKEVSKEIGKHCPSLADWKSTKSLISSVIKRNLYLA